MEFLDKICEAGVVGAGGAGFPTHKKLNCKVDYFIVNGCECEPLLKTDQYLMKEKAKEIIEAIEVISKEVGAKKSIIGIKSKYVEQRKALEDEILNSGYSIQLQLLDNFYPAGDEHVLVQEVVGKSVPPLGIPLQVGVVVDNVETLVNVYGALNDKPVTHRYVSVLGEVKEPRVMKVPIGTSIKKVIEGAGGTLIKDFVFVLGGPMMGKQYVGDKAEDMYVTKTTGAVIILPRDSFLVENNKSDMEAMIKRAKSVCIQCRTCTEMCPRYLNGHPLEPHKIMRAVAFGKAHSEITNALLCSECGVCEMYACPMLLSPRQINGYLKEVLRKNNFKFSTQEREFFSRDTREYKKVPTTRLIGRLGLEQYSHQKIHDFFEMESKEVKVSLKQHIGMPATPIVSVGDKIECGQLIGKIEEGKLGSNIHASITGTVKEVNEFITIINDED